MTVTEPRPAVVARDVVQVYGFLRAGLLADGRISGDIDAPTTESVLTGPGS